jgi:malate dehydrogenase (oxaloacetate-decarboxylating)(NADP+)
MVRSAVQAKVEGIAEPMILGDTNIIKQVAADAELSLEGMAVINPREDDRLENFIEIYASDREIKRAIAKKLMRW